MRCPKDAPASPHPVRAGAATRRTRWWPLLVVLLSSGCHAYTPVFGGRPEAGRRVSLAISDEGRVALARQVSPGVLTVQGTLVGVQQDEYLLDVYEVRTIDGVVSHWSGERVMVKQEHVTGILERRFSKGRTVAAAAAATAGLVVVALASRLIGGSSAGRDGGSGGGGSEQ